MQKHWKLSQNRIIMESTTLETNFKWWLATHCISNRKWFILYMRALPLVAMRLPRKVWHYKIKNICWKNQYFSATCQEAYSAGSRVTGVKTLLYNGYQFKAFCMYDPQTRLGWFFPSTQAVTNNATFTLNLESQYTHRDQAKVRIFFQNGDQKDSVLEQLTMYQEDR